MSTAANSYNRTIAPTSNRNEIKTKFWGLTCETGLKYNQRVKKKYCVTQAVLDPESYKKDDALKFVSLMVEHDDEEHIMAVLRHGDIYQVNLNMLFDRENVTFYLKGSGVVNLLGYEIIDPDNEASESFTTSPSKGNKTSKMKSDDLETENLSNSKMLKSGKKSKSPKKVDNEDITSDNYMIKLLEMSDDDDDDEDFSANGEESGEEDSDEEVDEDVSEEDESEDNDELEMMENGSESEDDDVSVPPVVQKRKKKAEKEKSHKRSKMEASPTAVPPKKSTDMVVLDGSSNDSSDVVAIPIKKKNKKKNKALNNSIKLDKAQQTISSTRTVEGGVEVTDLKIGHGPVATKGKLLHVFYIGRLADKQVFDSVLPGKRPFSFKLGAKMVIKGWDVGLEGMKAGGKRKIKVPPSMGYGGKSIDGIPPNSTLYFTIELQAVS